MKNWLEKQFRLSEFNTNIKTELLAGLTTFVTMAYVLATIPNILAGAGYDKHTTLTAMILLIILTSCAMALVTNRPFALAPGLGSVGIIASMITNEGVSMPIAAGVIFWIAAVQQTNRPEHPVPNGQIHPQRSDPYKHHHTNPVHFHNTI